MTDDNNNRPFSEFDSSFGDFGSNPDNTIYNYFKDLFGTFDPSFFDMVKKATALQPYGFDKNAYSRAETGIASQSKDAASSIGAIARAQGFGTSGGVNTALQTAPFVAGANSLAGTAEALTKKAKSRPSFLAMLLNAIIDPQSMALAESSGYDKSLANFGSGNDYYAMLGSLFGNSDFGKLFG